MFFWARDLTPYYYVISSLFAAVMVLTVVNNSMDSTAKITWLFLLMFAPVFGASFYLYHKFNWGSRAAAKSFRNCIFLSRDKITQNPEVLESLSAESPENASLLQYLNRSGCFPVFNKTYCCYFPMGEDMFISMISELRLAKKFIFMEYFIIDEGTMWGAILELLVEKAKAGVEVRVMFDGMCEFSTLSPDYPERMEKEGIRCKMFAGMTPFLSTHYNNRDHRKILVIDGETAFTGGVNLADEYINQRVRFGKWKDTGIMLKGEAARSFTLMFLVMWNVRSKDVSFGDYLNDPFPVYPESKGYVIPYADNPIDGDKVGEHVYMDILNRANRYVHIMTPYLILDGELETALKLCSARGVDVSIILPGIPDKRLPYILAKRHFEELLL